MIVRYKPFGGSWRKLQLRRKNDGWAGLIDCGEVTTTGSLKYYITLLDKGGDPITSLGSIDEPMVTEIKNNLSGPAPHLPNEAPPAPCSSKADCPPGLPGCTSGDERGTTGWGAQCETTRDCREGLECIDELCEEASDGKDQASDAGSKTIVRNWIGLAGQFDLAIVSGTDVCGRMSQSSNGFSCFTTESPSSSQIAAGRVPAGTHYHGVPVAENHGNTIEGGLAMGTMRVIAAYERVLGDNFTLGGHVGFAFGGAPASDGGRSFLPLHLEGRGAYWLGATPFRRSGFRAFMLVAGGMAQVDSKVTVTVSEDERACDSNSGGCVREGDDFRYTFQLKPNGAKYNQVHPRKQQLDVWRKSGQGFAGGGFGLMYAFTPTVGLVAEAKVNLLFPTFNVVVAPTLGMRYGF